MEMIGLCCDVKADEVYVFSSKNGRLGPLRNRFSEKDGKRSTNTAGNLLDKCDHKSVIGCGKRRVSFGNSNKKGGYCFQSQALDSEKYPEAKLSMFLNSTEIKNAFSNLGGAGRPQTEAGLQDEVPFVDFLRKDFDNHTSC